MSKVYREVGQGVLLNIYGELEIWKTDLEGRSKKIRHIKNNIVDGGEIWVAEMLAGEQSNNTILSYGAGELGWGLQNVQIGWGTASPATNDYSLQSVGGITMTYTDLDNDVDTPYNKIISRGTYSTEEAISTTDLTEAGLFSNTSIPGSSTDTSSRMFNRTTFGGISKTSGSTFALTLQWTITIGVVV